MGRLSRHPTPSASGAAIFYGVQSNGNQSNQIASPPSLDNTSEVSKSNATTITTTSDLISSSVITTRGYTSVKDILDKRGISTVQTVISLAKDVLATFKNVPYVQVVASLVQQIITISNEVQGNKERSKELVGKVVTYARVVFDALMELQAQEAKGLEEDLLQIANVLQSIYEVLQYLSGPKSMSLFNRVIYRDDIASKLASEDRRLDTTITAFQLKSSIVLRSGKESPRISITKDSRLLLASTACRPTPLIAIRAKPQIFFGRSKEVNVIVNTLLHNSDEHDEEQEYPTRKLCILGPGGIGKTALALSVMYQENINVKFQERRFFVPCEAAATPELFLNQIGLSLGIAMEHAKENILDLILRHLGKLSSLVILDNFETAWDPVDTRAEIETILSNITSLSTVFLIVTMRGTQRPSGTLWFKALPPLRPIDMDAAISIFKTISQKEDKHALDLIRAVDCVPLAVTLLANLASVDGETTEALWGRWKEENILMVENGQDRLNSVEVSVQLSLSSPRMQRDKGAISFLSIMSLLPDGLSPETLLACEKGLTEIQSVKKAISTLRQNALIYEDADKGLRVLSPIRLFMLAQHPLAAKSRSFIFDYFLKLASQGTQYHDAQNRLRLHREANNIDAILFEVLEKADDEALPGVVDATVKFCHFTYVSGRGTTKVISHAIEKLEAMKISSRMNVDIPKPILATRKRAWHKALMGFGQNRSGKDRTLDVAEASTISIDPTLKLRADCLGCLGQVLSRQLDIDMAEEKFLEAKELHKKAGDQAGEAYDLLNLGLLLSVNSQSSKEALAAFKEARDIHNKLGDKVGLAHALMGTGHIYRDECNFSEAERQFNMALELLIDSGNEVGQAAVLNGLGSIMLSQSKCAQGEKFYMDATRLCINIGDIVGEAENLAGLAVTYLLRSRFQEALQTIQKAIELRSEAFADPDHLHILGRVYIAMGQLDQAKALLSRAQSMHEAAGDKRGQADDLMYLSSIEFEQNHSQAARNLAMEALTLQDNILVEADITLLLAIVDIRQLRLDSATRLLAEAMKSYSDKGCTLGRAQCLYIQGLLAIRRLSFSDAMEALQHALSLHVEVGNVQAQADDLNKICEVLLRQGMLEEPIKLVCEALALHIQIGDQTGQADDLCVQASLFLAQGRLSDAEMTIRQALKMHEETGSLYGIARDCAYLSDIVWKQRIQQRERPLEQTDLVQTDDYLPYIRKALVLFRKLGAVREFHDCRDQKRRMTGKKPLSKYTRLPYWTTTSDEEYSEEYTIYEDDDSDY